MSERGGMLEVFEAGLRAEYPDAPDDVIQFVVRYRVEHPERWVPHRLPDVVRGTLAPYVRPPRYRVPWECVTWQTHWA